MYQQHDRLDLAGQYAEVVIRVGTCTSVSRS
jgi:hypothetical protein